LADIHKLVTAAREYLGTPFKHQGRSIRGIDCGGLLVLACKDIGIELDDIGGYSRMPDGITMKAEFDRQLVRVAEAQAGDVYIMAFFKHPQHVAIVTDIGIIHAFEGVDKVVEHNLDARWKSRIKGIYRLKG
jgi:cell wall-associated NlpC family hydrolase